MANLYPFDKNAVDSLTDAVKFWIDKAATSYTVTWTTIKSALKTYFDTLYGAIASINVWTAAQRGTVTGLTVSANAIAVDLAVSNNFSVTLQNTTTQDLSAPSNPVAGQSGAIAITQAATPSLLTYNAFWDFNGTAPAVSTVAGSVDVLCYYVVSGTKARCTLVKE